MEGELHKRSALGIINHSHGTEVACCQAVTNCDRDYDQSGALQGRLGVAKRGRQCLGMTRWTNKSRHQIAYLFYYLHHNTPTKTIKHFRA